MKKYKKSSLILVFFISAIMIFTACTQQETNDSNVETKENGMEQNNDNGEEQKQGNDSNSTDGKEEETETKTTFPSISIGEEAPDFTLENLEGDLVSLSDYRGKTVFVNFWASWCPPCKAEMPDLNKIHIENKDNDFLVLAVDVRESRGTVQKFIDEGGYEFPVLLDEDGDIATRYLVTGIPKTVVVGEDGTIRYVKMGMMTYPEMRQILETVTQ